MLTMMRTKTFWFVAFILLAYGIIQFGGEDDGSNEPDAKPTDELVNLALEVTMADSKRDSIQVAIAATLGSAGNFANKDAKIWEGVRFPKRTYTHKFQAKRGDAVNAEVVNKNAPVTLMVCFFLQEGQGQGNVLPGYGDITGPHLNAAQGGTLARCAATVR